MQYLCLVHVDRDLAAALTPAEQEAFDRDNQAYIEYLRTGPSSVFSALQAPETAALIRSRNGAVSMTDGPYVETKEHVAGFMLIDARDREEALAIAARSPVARIGTLEVRALSHGHADDAR